MRKLLFLSTVLLLLSVMSLAGVCVAGGPQSKPFVAKWTGTLYDAGFCDANNVLTVNVGRGVSSLIGPSSFVFMYCIPLDLASPGAGWGVITAATGDTLHVRISDLTVDITQIPPAWSEHETLIGGTGKFANADGETDSQGTWTSETDPFPTGAGGISVPPLLLAPQDWVGTSHGSMRF